MAASKGSNMIFLIFCNAFTKVSSVTCASPSLRLLCKLMCKMAVIDKGITGMQLQSGKTSWLKVRGKEAKMCFLDRVCTKEGSCANAHCKINRNYFKLGIVESSFSRVIECQYRAVNEQNRPSLTGIVVSSRDWLVACTTVWHWLFTSLSILYKKQRNEGESGNM